MNKIGTKAFKTKFINKQKQITSLRNHKLQKSCEINTSFVLMLKTFKRTHILI